jgi:hypothetical protein
MVETFEFRIPEEDARAHLGPDVGITLGGSVRKVDVPPSDPLFARIGEIDRAFRAKGSAFFTAWIPHRRYAAAELEAAEALQVTIKRLVEPAGEECGTVYDQTEVCQFCGMGERQVSDLILSAKALTKPKVLAIAKTLAGEIVVSSTFADVFQANGLAGAVFRPVRPKRDPSSAVPGWHQLCITSRPVTIMPPTRAGNGPFDDDREGRYRCPLSHTIGLNLLSELFISRADFDGADIAWTKQGVGVRRGLLRPERCLVVSPRFWRLATTHGLKGMGYEIAYVR